MLSSEKTNQDLNYPVTLTPDGGNILVTFVDVPEAITFGADEDEALLQAVDALESALSVYVAGSKPLPKPSKPKLGQKTVCTNEIRIRETTNAHLFKSTLL